MAVGVGVAVGVAVGVGLAVGVAVGVIVGVGVTVGVTVGVVVGVGVAFVSTQTGDLGFVSASGPVTCRANSVCKGSAVPAGPGPVLEMIVEPGIGPTC